LFKKIVSLMVALVMVLSLMAVGVVSVSAATIVQQGSCGDNVTYTLDSDGILTISGTGDMWDEAFRDNGRFNTSVTGKNIEKVVIESGVTSISDWAFYYCSHLTSITIPDSVTFIGDAAFCGCSSLTSLTIPDCFTSFGLGTFDGCNFTSIIIPDSVTFIGNSAFVDCRSLTSILISNSVTSIGDNTFNECSSLTSVTIPDSVTSIGDGAFNGCTSLASITIPDSVTEINDMAFYNGYSNHTDVYTSNQLAIDYFLHQGFHHSTLGEYYVNYPEEAPTPDNEITASGNDGTSIVTLDYDTANLRVTVPTVLPVSVDSDNNVTVSDSAKIVNNSKGQVDVTNAVLSGNNSWTLAAFDTDFTKVPVDTKRYGFKLQGYSVPVSGNAYNNQFATIDGNSALDLSYDANVAIQSDATTDAEIGNIVFTVAWHK